METIRPQPDATRPTLNATAVQLRALGVDEAQIARGERVATLIAAHSQDARLLAAAQLAQASGERLDLQSPAAQALWDAETLRLATALGTLSALGGEVGDDGARSLTPQQAEATRKMLLAVASDPRLMLARLAEQLLRLQEAKGQPAGRLRQLGHVTELLFAPLANRLGIWSLKWELEDLAFRYQHPADYQAIAGALAERRVDRERYIDALCQELRTALAAAGIQAEVYGRPKHIYSIWRKMQRKHVAFGEVFDVRALRIVVANVADCYAALGLVHGRWPYIPSEFDDYIATPKGNDYRSIHTAVTGPGGRPVEIQIRTAEMHEKAELGLAAHWRYKEGGGRDARYEQKIEWARRLLEPDAGGAGAGGEPAADYLDELRRTLFADRIYVLTPKGDVIDLPRGATALDFAYHVHTSLGHRCRGAKANGRIIALDTPLANGAIVEVIAGRSGGPSRDWLNAEAGFLASPRSRAKVRAWFHQQELTEAAGAATAPTVAAAPAASPAEAPVPEPPPLRRRQRASGTPPRSRHTLVLFEGVDDLPSTLARCCGPVPPLAIAGYLTLGRGVTVHRAECPALARMRAQKPERVLRARWNLAENDRMPVRLRIEAFERRDLLRDVSDLLAQSNLWLDGLDTRRNEADRSTTLTLDTAVRDQSQLAALLRALTRLPNVVAAQRVE